MNAVHLLLTHCNMHRRVWPVSTYQDYSIGIFSENVFRCKNIKIDGGKMDCISSRHVREHKAVELRGLMETMCCRKPVGDVFRRSSVCVSMSIINGCFNMLCVFVCVHISDHIVHICMYVCIDHHRSS